MELFGFLFLFAVFSSIKAIDDYENENESYKYEPSENSTFSSSDFENMLNRIDRKIIFNENLPVRYFKIHLVIDNKAFKLLDKSITKTRTWALNLINLVDALYQHANFRVYLTVLEILKNQNENPINLDPENDTAKNVLVKFRNYISTYKSDNDYHELLSASILITASGWKDNYIKGRASKAPCTVDGVAIVEFNSQPENIAYLFAHELGHVFDMRHPDEYDEPERCACLKGANSKGCLINSGYNFLASEEPQFTVCDIETINNQDLPCLAKPPKLFVSSTCGNGITEPGEDCDCGAGGDCQANCCNASTCLLKEGAECARGPCCNECKFKPKHVVCRAQSNECDLPEFCTGDDEWCPDDMYKTNGLTCSRKNGFCWDGECQLRDKQCQHLWGKGAVSAPLRYYDYNIAYDYAPYLNEKGPLNCGWDENSTFAVPCSENDKLCGALLCKLPPKQTQTKVYEPYSYSKLGQTQTLIYFSKTLSDGHNSVGKVAQGTACGTTEDLGICAKSGNLHYCEYNLKKYYPKSCESLDGLLCGGSNHGYCNQYERCICKEGYDQKTNCVTRVKSDHVTQNFQCYTCYDEHDCAKISNHTHVSTCSREDMICYQVMVRYQNNPTYSYYRGCITKEKCNPGCMKDAYTESCMLCCNHNKCNKF